MENFIFCAAYSNEIRNTVHNMDAIFALKSQWVQSTFWIDKFFFSINIIVQHSKLKSYSHKAPKF